MEKERRRKGKKKSNLLESKFVGMEWNWNANVTELSQQKNSMQKGMEMEWK